MILWTFNDRWGPAPTEEDADQVNVPQMIMNELYDRHYKKPHIAQWILQFRDKKKKARQEENGVVSGSMVPLPGTPKDKIARSKSKGENRAPDDVSQSKDVENESKALQSNKEAEESRVIHGSPLRKVSKSGFGLNPHRESREPVTLEKSKDRTPTKKDIKKKKIWLKESMIKPVKRERNENSFEDFEEFDKLVPMVKASPHEQPVIMDMNQIFAERIKERYRSTDRFIRVDQ